MILLDNEKKSFIFNEFINNFDIDMKISFENIKDSDNIKISIKDFDYNMNEEIISESIIDKNILSDLFILFSLFSKNNQLYNIFEEYLSELF